MEVGGEVGCWKEVEGLWQGGWKEGVGLAIADRKIVSWV
jgi:hypothetical protein